MAICFPSWGWKEIMDKCQNPQRQEAQENMQIIPGLQKSNMHAHFCQQWQSKQT